jgi:glycosyltransferase involved in cell wall biosynthesis
MAENLEKINVLWLVDHLGFNGVMHGASKYYINTIPYFDKKTFNVLLCVLRKEDHITNIFKDHNINVRHLGRGKFDIRTIIDIWKLARKEKVHIIHAHGYGAANFGRLSRVIRNIPVIVHAHDDDRNYPFHQKIADFLLSSFTDKTIAISEYVKESCVNKRSFSNQKVDVMYNGIQLLDFAAPEEERIEKERKRLGIKPDSKVIGTVTRLREEKGVKYLIQSAEKVLEAFPGAVFLVAGDGPLKNDLQSLSGKLGLGKKFIFAGFCKDIPAILSLLDIVVIPSLTEGLGMAVIEAMAMGKPIVASSVGGIKELLKDGKTALLVPPKDPKALAEKIIYLMTHQNEAKQIGLRAKEESKKYDISAHVKTLGNYYRNLLHLREDQVAI